jgi:hypothetical protein
MSDDIETLLNAALDGRLTEAEAQRWRVFLKDATLARRFAAARRRRELLRSQIPAPTQQQSQRMWNGIRARIEAAESVPAPLSFRRRMEAFWTRPWVSGWSWGLAGAAAAFVLFLGLRPRLQPLTAPAVPGSVPAAVSAPQAPPVRTAARPAEVRSVASAPQGRTSAPLPLKTSTASDRTLAAVSRRSPTPSGPTEVEQALADNQVDAMIEQFLAARQQSGPSLAVVPQGRSLERPSLNGSGVGNLGGAGASANVAYESVVPALPAPEALAAGASAQGGKDANGFWNWKPAAEALNGREWSQAKLELEAAAQKAASPAERSFAVSAWSLLAAPGGPLENNRTPVFEDGALRVLAAGSWQLLVDQRLARFTGGVAVRLPGLRVEADSMLLDLTFDRAEFSPGAHFTRVQDPEPTRAMDSASQVLTASDFYAPSGADDSLPERILRVK